VLIFAALAVLVMAFLWLRGPKTNGAATSYHQVKRGDFVVSVVEGGTLAAVSEVSIRNEVEGTARIISIVPEGSYVKKGDLLVELDSAQAQDQVNQQQINFEKAKFAVEQARAQLDIQKSATNSDYLAATLKLKFAQIDREKYLQGQRVVDLMEASNKVIEVRSQLENVLDTYRFTTNLAAKGYETRSRQDQDWLTVLRTQNSLISTSNTIWMLQTFDQPKALQRYDSDVLQAEQELERVVNQNKRRMAQFEADLNSQINTLALSESKLERDKRNLAATKIYAPQDGLVVFQVSENRFSSESLIEGGATVRNRQEIIKLPDLSRMKVTVKVHESHVNMIRPGLPAFVILDSEPDSRYRGVVERVAPLPDTQARWGNPNLKVYNTEIHLLEIPLNVKPGISAKAEIIVTNIANALSVPVQAVTTLKGKQVVYLARGKNSEPNPVEVGLFNTKFIEIVSGLKEGDRVLLSPPFDVQDKDLTGEVLAEDEKSRLATNAPVRPTVLATEAAPAVIAATTSAPTGPNNGAALAEPGSAGGGPDGGPAARGGAGRRGNFNPEEMLKQWDKDGDGQLDESEREAMRSAMAARFGGQGGQGQGGNRLNREEMLKRFDTNGDGELDETERAAMREGFGGGAGRTNRTDRRLQGEGGGGRGAQGGGGGRPEPDASGGGRNP
jgi:HlyD family secretion protein